MCRNLRCQCRLYRSKPCTSVQLPKRIPRWSIQLLYSSRSRFVLRNELRQKPFTETQKVRCDFFYFVCVYESMYVLKNMCMNLKHPTYLPWNLLLKFLFAVVVCAQQLHMINCCSNLEFIFFQSFYVLLKSVERSSLCQLILLCQNFIVGILMKWKPTQSKQNNAKQFNNLRIVCRRFWFECY